MKYRIEYRSREGGDWQPYVNEVFVEPVTQAQAEDRVRRLNKLNQQHWEFRVVEIVA